MPCNRQIFSDYEINDEHNKIIHSIIICMYTRRGYVKQQNNTDEEKISFLHDFREALEIICNFF